MAHLKKKKNSKLSLVFSFGQSYKYFTLVNYYCRVVMTIELSKLLQ